MNLLELFRLRTNLLEEFEEDFSKMTFASEHEKNKYYNAYQEGMANFFVNSMITIMDKEYESSKKAA